MGACDERNFSHRNYSDIGSSPFQLVRTNCRNIQRQVNRFHQGRVGDSVQERFGIQISNDRYLNFTHAIVLNGKNSKLWELHRSGEQLKMDYGNNVDFVTFAQNS